MAAQVELLILHAHAFSVIVREHDRLPVGRISPRLKIIHFADQFLMAEDHYVFSLIFYDADRFRLGIRQNLFADDFRDGDPFRQHILGGRGGGDHGIQGSGSFLSMMDQKTATGL